MVSVLLDLNIWLMSVLEIQTNFTPFVACFYYFWYVQVIIKLNPGPRKNNTSYNFSFCLWNLNPTQDENFRGCSRMRGRGPKKPPPTLKSVTHILQWWNVAQLHLTQRRSKKKKMNHVIHWILLTSAFFSPEISKFCYIKKYRYRLHFST